MTLRLASALALAGLLLTGPAKARPADKPFVIYMVQWRGHTPTDDGFRDFLAGEGVPAQFILRNADRKTEDLPSIIADIKKTKPDLVYAWGVGGLAGLVGTLNEVKADPQSYITDIPVVGCTVADPVGAQLSESLQSSGRNFTGVSHVPPVPVQLNAIKMYDELKTLAVLYNPTEGSPMAAVEELRRLAPQEKFQLLEFPVPLDGQGVPRADALPGLVAEIAKAKPSFLYLGPDSFLAVNNRVVTEAAIAQNLPVFGAAEVFVRDSPGLMGLVSRYYNVGQYCGYKAKQILVDHRQPKDIPFDTLKRFSFIVNKYAAQQLKYYPPLTIIDFIEIADSM